MASPTILVYGPNEDAPETMRYAAAMVPMLKPGKTPKHKDPYVAGSQWLTTGRTAEEARAKLEAIWTRQYPPPVDRSAILVKARAARSKPPEPDILL